MNNLQKGARTQAFFAVPRNGFFSSYFAPLQAYLSAPGVSIYISDFCMRYLRKIGV